MNYTTWSKKKFWIIIIGVFFLGVIMSSGKTTTITKEVPVEKTITKEVVKEVPQVTYIDKDRETWLKLVDIDDKIMAQASLGLIVSSKIVGDMSKFDYTNLNNYTQQLQNATAMIEDLSTQRHVLLKQLNLE